jgi:hypothetical protein
MTGVPFAKQPPPPLAHTVADAQNTNSIAAKKVHFFIGSFTISDKGKNRTEPDGASGRKTVHPAGRDLQIRNYSKEAPK